MIKRKITAYFINIYIYLFKYFINIYIYLNKHERKLGECVLYVLECFLRGKVEKDMGIEEKT